MLKLLKVGFQLLLLSGKLWEVEGDACGLLVVVYQLLLRLAVAQFGCVVAVVSMWITILSLRCIWSPSLEMRFGDPSLLTSRWRARAPGTPPPSDSFRSGRDPPS